MSVKIHQKTLTGLVSNDGNALVVTLLVTLALSGLVLGALMSTQTETRLCSNQSQQEKAFYLAERGVEESIAYLAQLGAPYIGGGANGGDPVLLIADKDCGEGSYSAYLDPLDSNTGQASRFVAVTVRSVLSGSGLSKVMQVKLGQQNFSRFAYFTDLEHHAGGGTIWFTTSGEFFGPVHSNDQFHIYGSPVFHEEVSSGASSIDYYHGGPPQDDPVFDMGITLNSSSIPLPANTDLLRAKGLEADGLFFSGNTVQVEMLVNGSNEGKLNVKVDGGAWTEYDIPTNGVCYISGLARIWGELKGQMTIACDDDIEIMDNLIYSDDPRVNPSSADILGLVAEQDVFMDGDPYGANVDVSDETIMGAIMALGFSFTVENYASGTPRGTLVLYGGLIQQYRGPVGTFSGSTGQPVSGYTKHYTFDPRLSNNPPPAFPTTGQVEKISWAEIDASNDISSNVW